MACNRAAQTVVGAQGEVTNGAPTEGVGGGGAWNSLYYNKGPGGPTQNIFLNQSSINAIYAL